MDYQWYPGHMTKAKRMMQENLKLIDLIIELLDARIPLSSRNPDIDRLGQGKARLILLNKADLADPVYNDAWRGYFEAQGFFVYPMDSQKGGGVKNVTALISEACKEKIERDRRRGIKNRPVRAMVAGIPNVGKSTFINAMIGRACAKTGNKPGVTKGKQWIRLNKNVELLDTPGLLWPKFEDQEVGRKLACVGAIKDELLDQDELAFALLAFLGDHYPETLEKRYAVPEKRDPSAMLEKIAENRHCVEKGGKADRRRAAKILTDDFRSGRLGRITLEFPPSSV